MHQRHLKIWFLLVVLSLVGQNLAANMLPCETAAPDTTQFSAALDEDCHADNDAHGTSVLPDSGHDCQQSCACPAGPSGMQAMTNPRTDLTDSQPDKRAASHPPSRSGDLLFRPPIQR